MRTRAGRWYAGLALVLVNALALPLQARAQTAAAFNHWAAIDRVLKEIGGIGSISNARPDQRGLLAFHYAERGQFFLDLYEYERLIVRDHALHRDSIEKHGGPAIPAAQYFLARAQQELGQSREARAAYSAAAKAPERIRALASDWSETLSPGGDKSWMRDVVSWRDGKTVAPATCPGATPACALFEAIVADDPAAIARTQRELLQGPQPDYRETIKIGTESYPVDFFDPLPILMVSR